MEKVFVYIDESGNVSKNLDGGKMVVGGYFCSEAKKQAITRDYKVINKYIKEKNKIDIKKELKGKEIGFTDRKILIDNFTRKGAIPITCIIDGSDELVKKRISKGADIFFNNIVAQIMDKIVNYYNKNTDFIVQIDNRNLPRFKFKSLEDSLNQKYIDINGKFEITYHNSQGNFGVQIADIIVNSVLVEEHIKDGKDITLFCDHKNYESAGKELIKILEKSDWIKI